MIFVNFKIYNEGTGENALSLAKTLEKVAVEKKIKVIPVVQASDVKEIATSTTLEIWVQKIDPVEFGAHTGMVIPEAVFEDGAAGTLLNHSENRAENFSFLQKSVERATQAGLKTLVFAKDMQELKKISRLNPTYLSYEPPELVGNPDTSVAQERPEVIAKAVVISRGKGIPLVVGAGIKSKEDVKKSLELGAVGVAVASSVVKSADPKASLEELVLGF